MGWAGGGASHCTLPLAGYSRDDVDVVELHDCFSTNELITYEALGLCQPGTVQEEPTHPVVFTRRRGRVGVGFTSHCSCQYPAWHVVSDRGWSILLD